MSADIRPSRFAMPSVLAALAMAVPTGYGFGVGRPRTSAGELDPVDEPTQAPAPMIDRRDRAQEKRERKQARRRVEAIRTQDGLKCAKRDMMWRYGRYPVCRPGTKDVMHLEGRKW